MSGTVTSTPVAWGPCALALLLALAVSAVMSFGLRLRHGADLTSLTADLRDVVDQTMGPAHLSVWLRPSTGSTGAVP